MGVQEERIWQLINRFSGYRQKGLVWNIILFGRVLKELGIKVTLATILDAVRSLSFINLREKRDFCYALQANLVSSLEEILIFQQAFQVFWSHIEEENWEERTSYRRDYDENGNSETVTDLPLNRGDGGVSLSQEDEAGQKEAEGLWYYRSYSTYEALKRKDFSSFQAEDMRAYRDLITNLIPKLATRFSRRKRVHTKGADLDLRKSLRKNMKYGGDILELVQKRRRLKKPRLVLVCDVSGSMDCYSRFLIQFMYGLQNRLTQLETFVFSTRLSRIGHLLRAREIDQALTKVSEIALDWSGGTAIGSCLQTFNEEFMQAKAGNKTIVIIISDGWDRGDAGLLAREMKRTRQKVNKIFWLNPLLGSHSYQPLCKGMQAALPYIDHFLPAHNLESLVTLCKRLREFN